MTHDEHCGARSGGWTAGRCNCRLSLPVERVEWHNRTALAWLVAFLVGTAGAWLAFCAIVLSVTGA